MGTFSNFGILMAMLGALAACSSRVGFSGCDTYGFCSSSNSNLVWGGWVTYKSCTSTQYCKVSFATLPGSCSTAP